ncbi:alpha/beta hydrolase [Streptomyces sp. V4I8]|uniref:alpha/beta hydrolase n=1 Tax=Streptomyces sp. V4I8 TaxID=3156469 RepID=UPI003517D4A6
MAAVGAAMVLLAAAGACDGGGKGDRDKDATRALAAQKLRWAACPAPAAEAESAGPADGAGWECARMTVPVDWSDPGEEQMKLALIRGRATGPGRRIGSLVFNFGGPGQPGVSMLPAAAQSYQDFATLRTRYDLVSFDPRGTGDSRPVRCLDDSAQDKASAADKTPDTPAEMTTLLHLARANTQACAKHSGPLLAHIGTRSTARDLDLLRQVLGDDTLSYLGFSYGTELGAVYAHLYPRKVGRAVFDAVTNPADTPVQTALGQAEGFQLALGDFLKDCTRRHGNCPAGDTVKQATATIRTLLSRLERTPLPTQDGRPLTQTGALNGIIQALYARSYWPSLQEGLNEAMQQGSGNVLLALSDQLTGRDPQGHYSTVQAANIATLCADTPHRYTPDDVKKSLPAFRKASPVFGSHVAWGQLLQCTDWPVAGTANTPVTATGSPAILLIATTGDPATPRTNLPRMARQLGPRTAIQITRNGDGHTAYGTSPCVTDIVNAYLLTGTHPKTGTTCTT